jgi:glycogen debranching enzyme
MAQNLSVGAAGSVSLKENRIELVTNVCGDIPRLNPEGFGLYMNDTRFLSTFEILLEDQSPIYLSHSAERNYIATFQFVNPTMTLADGTRIRRQTISIRRSRFVDAGGLYERIGLYNCNQFPVELELSVSLDADFLDIFAVRDYFPHRRSSRSSVHAQPSRLTFSYTGRDRIRRKTVVDFDRKPETISTSTLLFRFKLAPHRAESLTTVIRPLLGDQKASRPVPFEDALQSLARSYESWEASSTAFETNNEYFDKSLVRQSCLDIRALLEFSPADRTGSADGGVVPVAGIPWYAVPFGRDAIITALQTLSYNPAIAIGTLRFCAQHQGIQLNEKTEEQLGKIFHEIRRGELANLGEIPHVPYYGTVDATPLFVVLFVETMAWLGQSRAGRQLYEELLPSVLRALAWVDSFGDEDGDGYVEYQPRHGKMLSNQGWKDSAESLLYPDGSVPPGPIALVEVQGYVYEAKNRLAALMHLEGDHALAGRLGAEAQRLKDRFNSDFWMPDEHYYAQALDGSKKQVPSVTSNVGHLLRTGIVAQERVTAVVDRLMADDMFSGWGIRTLSTASPNYNPMSYHNGSVWPHDNSLIAHGMRGSGFGAQASEVITAMISAGLRFPGNRLPELFCGFTRDRRFNSSPVGYIISCSPQAWAAAAPFLFLQTLLDLQPQPDGSITINPVGSQLFRRYNIRQMRVGDSRVSFEAEVGREGSTVRATEGIARLAVEAAAA